MAKVTLEKIAKDIGVSKVTVFKALNNKKGVSDELRQKIIEYAQSCGYINKTLEAKNKKFIFFINQDFFLSPTEKFYSTIFYFLSSECSKTNSFLQIAFLESNNTIEKMNDIINSFRPDGLFMAGQIGNEIVNFLAEINLPIVFLDFFSPFRDYNYVHVDNYYLSYKLTKYLISKGHKKIGFVGNINSTSSIADRFFGYRKAMNEENLPVNNDWHINKNLEANEKLTDILCEPLPTAYICHCDAAAQKIYSLCALKNISIPDDISVISFDNTPLCENMIPKLTSAGPKKEDFAKVAFNTMLKALKKKNITENIFINATLSERDSVKDIN